MKIIIPYGFCPEINAVLLASLPQRERYRKLIKTLNGHPNKKFLVFIEGKNKGYSTKIEFVRIADEDTIEFVAEKSDDNPEDPFCVQVSAQDYTNYLIRANNEYKPKDFVQETILSGYPIEIRFLNNVRE